MAIIYSKTEISRELVRSLDLVQDFSKFDGFEFFLAKILPNLMDLGFFWGFFGGFSERTLRKPRFEWLFGDPAFTKVWRDQGFDFGATIHFRKQCSRISEIPQKGSPRFPGELFWDSGDPRNLLYIVAKLGRSVSSTQRGNQSCCSGNESTLKTIMTRNLLSVFFEHGSAP